jgi:hypothetical protein
LDEVSIGGFFADVMNGDDIGVRPQPGHGLRLALHTLAPLRIQSLGLYDREGNIAVEALVVGKIDALPSAPPEKAQDPVAAGD